MEEVHLNTSALSDPNSLRVPLTSVIIALIDSGSTDCFVDSNFAHTQDLPLTSIPPIRLRLLDGTSSAIITQTTSIPVTFETGESMIIDFYVTPLDPSCAVVLGYNWLTRYNPMIDWVLGSITFRSQLLDGRVPPPSSYARSAPLPSRQLPETPFSVEHPRVALIGAAAFALAF